mgnify:CR=1 FL=1
MAFQMNTVETRLAGDVWTGMGKQSHKNSCAKANVREQECIDQKMRNVGQGEHYI